MQNFIYKQNVVQLLAKEIELQTILLYHFMEMLHFSNNTARLNTVETLFD